MAASPNAVTEKATILKRKVLSVLEDKCESDHPGHPMRF
ncbi:hypothetical protein PC129_g15775 [Phytophthora cactorum]|uniref:Uncharacterized protein n=1 Tax=Phytophthora cactorum TaxID=29920 RepID=A0A8T0Z6H6_9STRA|nr:hypothetical protein PC112_g11231 [Phytophthora cactorum]KAG2857603.1 hypothetical protein PC113_g10534 [Phytophthora cactorum]KAG2903319.1 hypothetical protein PC114_g12320 [Phytophthora cactorum]KAG2918507.1 hypothetical protein PC115_g10426 [Phytophthora cactorum]KAG2939848.1 hypothetical protein PC117_g10781 [Phytophthora cactorum]